MASTFAFGFSGDDIDVDDDAENEMHIDTAQGIQDKEPELLSPQKHTLGEILSTLPSSLSYNTLSVPLAHPSRREAPHRWTKVRRRSLFDAVAQLKAEADITPRLDHPEVVTNPSPSRASGGGRASGYDYDGLISALESGDDLRSRVYEGGLKTWECGVDLASYLASSLCLDGRGEGDPDLWGLLRDLRICSAGHEGDDFEAEGGVDEGGGFDGRDDDVGFDVIELGAGSAIPSLVLLNHVLRMRRRRRRRKQGESDVHIEGRAGTGRGSVRFILCDYNIEVLRLVTGANILLQLQRKAGDTKTALNSHEIGHEDTNGDDAGGYSGTEDADGEGELDNITPQLLHHTILPSLADAGISIDFISGAWGDAFVDLVYPSPISGPEKSGGPAPSVLECTAGVRPLLILSSEALYSPTSIQAFVSTLFSLLRRSQLCHPMHHHHDFNTTPRPTALIAAKKMYFGVGGGVDEFTVDVRRRGGIVDVLWDINDGGGGVGRVILKVALSDA